MLGLKETFHSVKLVLILIPLLLVGCRTVRSFLAKPELIYTDGKTLTIYKVWPEEISKYCTRQPSYQPQCCIYYRQEQGLPDEIYATNSDCLAHEICHHKERDLDHEKCGEIDWSYFEKVERYRMASEGLDK